MDTPTPQSMESTELASQSVREDVSERAATWQHTPGEMVGNKYRLVRPIGRGGMAEVWLAVHTELKTDVAIKFVDAELSSDPLQSQTALERFRLEAQLSARLGARTRHVISVHDAGMHEGTPYLAMEYVEGQTLLAEVEERGPIDPARLADILDQLADALGVAHGMGIVHRDLKPSNLMVLDTPGKVMVKVADFGIAKAIRSDLAVDRPKETFAGALLGSPAYMSPEQLKDSSRVDHKTDIWAVGILAYEVLTGAAAFDGQNMAELIVGITAQSVEPPSKRRQTLPRKLDAWFERALAKDPAKRFESVHEQARAYRAALGVQQPERRPPWRGAIVASLAGVAVLGAFALVARRGAPPPLIARTLPSITGLQLQPIAPAPEAPPSSVTTSTTAPQVTPRTQPSAPAPAQSAEVAPSVTEPPAAPKPSAPPTRRKEINPNEVL